MESSVDAIKAKISIVDVVGSYLKLEKAGGNYRARCPFHNEKTPSFFVSPGRETYHCFGCSKGGDIFSFVEEVEGVEFKEALRILADRAGVVISKDNYQIGGQSRLRSAMDLAVRFYQSNLQRSKPARAYLVSRGLSPESIDKFALGYAPDGWRHLYEALKKRGVSDADMEGVGLIIKSPKGYYDRFRNRIMFPFFDFSGRPIGFSARLMPDSTDEGGKYINSPETPLFHKSRVFYGIDKANKAIRESDKLLLVEGQLDVIMAHQIGTDNCMGVSGTALTDEHIKLIIRQTENLTLVLDSDDAGFRASDRSVRMALSAGIYVSVVELPKGEDPASLIAKDKKAWSTALSKEKSFTEYALDYIGREYTDSRSAQEAMGEYLYPYISDMYNEIEKDKTLQRIATMLGVSAEAIRNDFKKWVLKNKESITEGESSANINARISEQTKTVLPNNIYLVASRLWGVLHLIESKISKQATHRDIIKTSLSGNYYELFRELYEGDKKGDLLFQAEVYYPDLGVLDKEVQILLLRLRQELLKEDFIDAMDKLRKAESGGDKEQVEEALSKCQEISIKLNELQQKKI